MIEKRWKAMMMVILRPDEVNILTYHEKDLSHCIARYKTSLPQFQGGFFFTPAPLMPRS